MAIEDNATTQFWRALGQSIGTPRGILCVSAHWTTRVPTIGAGAHPTTVHDFGGFAPELYEQKYPAPGDPKLASDIISRLGDAGVSVQSDYNHGFDHGVWVPLVHMYPDAKIPVVQLSVQPRESPGFHFSIGQTLATLRDQGILVLGSGGTTHNLSDVFQAMSGKSVPNYASEFVNWLVTCVDQQNNSEILNYATLGPHASRVHPTPEHLLPLFVALGAASDQRGRLLHDDLVYSVLSLSCFGWGVDLA